MVRGYDCTMPYHRTATSETPMEYRWYGGTVVRSPKGERKELSNTTSPLPLFLGQR